MNYGTLCEQELHNLISQGDASAENELVSRYTTLVRICARPYFLVGGDSEDLIQEGMMGLLSAVRQYDSSTGASFKTFAEKCVKNRIIGAVKSASRLKHVPLNDGVSLEEILSNESQPNSAVLADSFIRMPEEQVLARECTNDFISSYSRYLSKFETTVLNHYLNGLSYSEIADTLGRSVKSVDNAVQRIRHKLARHLNLGDIS